MVPLHHLVGLELSFTLILNEFFQICWRHLVNVNNWYSGRWQHLTGFELEWQTTSLLLPRKGHTLFEGDFNTIPMKRPHLHIG